MFKPLQALHTTNLLQHFLHNFTNTLQNKRLCTILHNFSQDFTQTLPNFHKSFKIKHISTQLYKTIHNSTKHYKTLQDLLNFTQTVHSFTKLYTSFFKHKENIQNSTKLYNTGQHFTNNFTRLLQDFIRLYRIFKNVFCLQKTLQHSAQLYKNLKNLY